jgi:drug/metabolite transporter (DMT)-like permease
MISNDRRHRWHILIAFALVYVFWGSTYLGIRIGIERIAPELLTGVRFLVAGAVMLVWCAVRGQGIRIRRGEALRLAVIGFLLLSISNFVLTWAEQWVPTGLAALIVSIVPLWFLILDSFVFPAEHRPSARALIGLALGAAGIVVLLWPELRNTSGIGWRELLGSVVLIGGSFAWALGSVLSKRWKLPIDPFTASAYQMIFAGSTNLLIGTAFGDWSRTVWTWRGAAALSYLIVFGSWVGFSAYIWLLEHVPTAKLATYAYVNPVIAVFLGWLVLKEAITGYILAGTAIVVVAVALVTGAKLRTRTGEEYQELPAVETGSD